MNLIMTFWASEGTLAEMRVHIDQPIPSHSSVLTVILSLWHGVIFSLLERLVENLALSNQYHVTLPFLQKMVRIL